MGDYANKLTALNTVTALPDAGAEYMIGDEGGGSDVINRCAKENRGYIEDLVDCAIGQNLLKNGDMEQWTNGASSAADDWTLSGAGASVARSTTKKFGTYSSAITTSGAAASYYQDIADYPRYKGIYVTLNCYVQCSTASAARIGISDGVATVWSSYHSGGGAMELLTISLAVDGTATQLRTLLQTDNTATTAYFDGAKLAEGQVATPFTPYIVSPYATETLRNKTLDAPIITDWSNILAHGIAYRTTTYDLVANNTWYNLPLNGGNDVLFNVSHDTGTNPERVTVALDGIYKVSYKVFVRDNGVGRAFVSRIYRGAIGEVIGSLGYVRTVGSTEHSPFLYAETICTLSAGDYLMIQIATNNATANPDVDMYDDANLPDPTTRSYAIMVVQMLRPI